MKISDQKLNFPKGFLAFEETKNEIPENKDSEIEEIKKMM